MVLVLVATLTSDGEGCQGAAVVEMAFDGDNINDEFLGDELFARLSNPRMQS